MGNDTILMVVSWCPGDKCDPCQTTGNLELFGNYQSPDVAGPAALCSASGVITSFPEFPVTVMANISLQGLYRPFVGPITDGGGSTTISGTSDGPGVSCLFASTSFQAPDSWNPNGSDQLLFNVKATSSTTSAAFLVTGTVSIIYHPTGGIPIDVSAKARWMGNVT